MIRLPATSRTISSLVWKWQVLCQSVIQCLLGKNLFKLIASALLITTLSTSLTADTDTEAASGIAVPASHSSLVNPDTPLAFVTNQGDNTVSVVDMNSYQNLISIPVGDQPAGVTIDPKGERVYVSNPGDGTITIIDTATLSALGQYKVGDGPLALVAGSDVLYVADWYDDLVLAIDTRIDLDHKTNTQPTLLTTYKVGRSPSGLVLSADEQTLYVSNRDDDNVQALTLTHSANPASVALPADSDTITKTDTDIASDTNTSTGTESSTNSTGNRIAGTGSRPFGMTLNKSGDRLYVVNVKSNTMSVIDTSNMQNLADVPVGERPYAVTLALDESRAFVSDQYDDTVTVIDTASLEVIDTLDVDEYPEGINTHPDDQHIIVANWFSNTLNVIDAMTLEVVQSIDVGDGPRAYGDFIRH